MKKPPKLPRPRRLRFFAVVWCLFTSAALLDSSTARGQSLQIVNMAIPSKSFQMVIYPLAQQKGYMREEGLDLRVIFIAPTTSIQAMLGGDVHFTGAGSSALVSVARGNVPLKVVAATNDRVLQWLVTKPEIASPRELKGKKIATTGVAAIATFMLK
ncbi:MAG TPA: ABC transporter substrate-binding protein, partial [Candidatus Binatia bacterium]|nr:ABC transporter substrate-binding protein [Candidatus Binatia bacterium]